MTPLRWNLFEETWQQKAPHGRHTMIQNTRCILMVWNIYRQLRILDTYAFFGVSMIDRMGYEETYPWMIFEMRKDALLDTIDASKASLKSLLKQVSRCSFCSRIWVNSLYLNPLCAMNRIPVVGNGFINPIMNWCSIQQKSNTCFVAFWEGLQPDYKFQVEGLQLQPPFTTWVWMIRVGWDSSGGRGGLVTGCFTHLQKTIATDGCWPW